MADVNWIANGLTRAVIAQNWDLQVVASEQLEPARNVIRFTQRSLHLEVIAPTAELQTRVAPFGSASGDILQGEIGPGVAE